MEIVSEVPNGILSRSSNIKEEVREGRREGRREVSCLWPVLRVAKRRADNGCVGP